VELADLVLWAVLLVVFGYLIAVIWAMARTVAADVRESQRRASR
jgi:hypothetical protein